MPAIQVPPGVGTSGQLLDAAGSSGALRQIISVGDFGTSAIAPVTTSAGALVNVSSGTFTLSSAPTVNVSSGTFTLSSNPTFVSASSGLVQISNPTTAVTISNSSFTVNLSTVFSLSSAPLIIVASSGGTIPVSLSTVFSLSSAPLVVVATSGGTIPVSLSTVFSLSSNPTIVSASSGLIQALLSSASFAPITSSYGQSVRLDKSPTPIFKFNSGSTFIAISTSPSVLWMLNVMATGSTASGGQVPVVRVYDGTTGTVTLGTSIKGVYQSGLVVITSAIGIEVQQGLNGQYNFGPLGMSFTSGITIDFSVNASSTTVAQHSGVGANVTALFV